MDSTKAAEIIAVAREGFDRMHARLDAMDAIQADIGASLDRVSARMAETLATLREMTGQDA
jgi:hypothetical protein